MGTWLRIQGGCSGSQIHMAGWKQSITPAASMWPCNGLVLPGWGLVAPQNHEVSRDGTMMHTSFPHRHLLVQSSHTPTPGLSTAFFVMIAWRPRFLYVFAISQRMCWETPEKGQCGNAPTLGASHCRWRRGPGLKNIRAAKRMGWRAVLVGYLSRGWVAKGPEATQGCRGIPNPML